MASSLSSIRAANAALGIQSPDLALTAVFVGATAGIGLATLRAFAKHIPNPTAIIVGRSRARFETQLQELKALNPKGTFEFVESEIELLRDVDAASALVTKTLQAQQQTKKEKTIDLLYLSQGYISFAGRQPNADGLDTSISLRYHGRVRFARNLLPALAPNARVISILAGGQEGKVFEDDLGLERNYSVPNSMSHFGSLMTLSFDALAAEPGNEGRVFIHAFPGVVNTGLLSKSATGVLALLFRWVVEPVLGLLVARSPEEVGERMLFYGTSEEMAGNEGKAVALDDKGVRREVEVLKGYREKGLAGRVVDFEEKAFEQAAR